MKADDKGIDYTRLSDKVVRQAIAAAGNVMDEGLRQRLIELKIERAKESFNSRHKEVDWHIEA